MQIRGQAVSVPTHRKMGTWQIFKKRWQLHAFMLIPLAYILIFAYGPMFGIVIAFKDFKARVGIWDSAWVGFQHFERFFRSYQFERVMVNTLRLSFYSLIAGFPIPIIFALMLNLMRNLKYKKLIQTVTYIPHFISVVVLVGFMLQIFNPITGLYGALFKLFGGMSPPMGPMDTGYMFPHIYVWSGIWQEFGWGSIIYVAALASVDPELHEAAMVDGASRLKRVFKIDLPAILPTVAILLIMRSGSIMSVGFEKVLLMQKTLNLMYSEVISTYVYKVGITQSPANPGYGAAIGLFNSLVNCVLLVTVNYLSKRFSENQTSLF